MSNCKNGQEHDPDIFTNQTSLIHETTKCLRCGASLIRISMGKWMSIEEYNKHINGVEDEI